MAPFPEVVLFSIFSMCSATCIAYTSSSVLCVRSFPIVEKAASCLVS